jgi:hypothetical protein
MLSEFEIYSLEDIANEFGFKIDDPLLYAGISKRNPELSQEDYYNMILKTAIRRQKSLNERNAAKLKSINYTEPEPPVLKQLTLFFSGSRI